MTGTPARDALYAALATEVSIALSPWEGDPDGMGFTDSATDQVMDGIAEVFDGDPSAVIAALVEAGWRPSDEELRAMGGHVLDHTRRPTHVGLPPSRGGPRAWMT